MRSLVLPARILFALIFVLSGFTHFSEQTISYAASAGVPLAHLAVPVSGLIALAGGLSVMLGYKAKIGGWLLVLFLVPVTFAMHAFWRESDPAAAMMQRVQFLKNLSLLGGALMIAYFGAGPLSVDAWQRTHASHRHPLPA